MRKQKPLWTGTTAGAVCALIVACSSSSSQTSSQSNPTPRGTTPVTSTPYPVCPGDGLAPGSFTASGSYAVPATKSCTPAGGPTSGPADTHCVGMPPQPVNGADCTVSDAGAVSTPAPTGDAGDDGGASDDSGASDDGGGQAPTPGPCDENGIDGAYGSTMYGTEGDDDDCKYHVNYSVSPVCENNGTYFVVTAVYLTGSGGPLTGASTLAELCLSDTHPAPQIDNRPPTGNQQVVEGPPGTYTIGPVQFDAPGDWTVRFHFNEFCCDVTDDSPHGHAAFHVTVP